MRILLVSPHRPGSRSGNQTTTERWAGILMAMGHEVQAESAYSGQPCDLLIALHAGKSLASIERFRREHPQKPLILALTGTDLYGGPRPELWRAIAVATRIVVLQPLAIDELPDPLKPKAHLIYQSVPLLPAPSRRGDKPTFDVAVIAHLRPVKDPLRTARAARLLPPSSRIRVVHIGGAMDTESETAALAEQRENPRFQWLGSVPRDEALQRLAECDLMVNSSLTEGGANAVGEAIVAGVPVVGSRIAGNVGMLGEDYPGYFEVGDTAGLAALLERVETDRQLYERLRAHCLAKRALYAPEREHHAWERLVTEAGHAEAEVVQVVDELSTLMRPGALPEPVSGLRRHPRVAVSAVGEIELWLTAGRGLEQRTRVAASLHNVSPAGLTLELTGDTGFDPQEVAAVYIRDESGSFAIPGHVSWIGAGGDSRRLGVELQLSGAQPTSRAEFSRWVRGLTRHGGP